MTLDERVVDRMISMGNIEDLRTDALDANDEYYASVLITMVRDAEAYVQGYINTAIYSDMHIDINEAIRDVDYQTLTGSD